ncbi:MAG: two-component sensor kinase [Candidatus Scalindua rubra]|uniref:histidine kinase n=1 Tax=Candidatus Scalindua rubra TaxID=1872076 RepID=A0A1E3XAG2_9BACT|nr:MAG: two-component sensor kinase [Candidatus Scalindua rubra]
MNIPIRVLIVEDSEDDTLLVVRELKRNGFDVIFERVDNHKAMEDALVKQEWDVVIADYSMPKFSMQGALELQRKNKPDITFIMISGTIGEEIAVEAIKAGADDYVMKDRLKRLAPAVKRELKEFEERQVLKRMEDAMQALIKSTVIKTGQDVFCRIVESVQEWLDTDYVCLGQIIDVDKVKVLSMHADGEFKYDCIYELKETLCEIVVKEGFCYYPEGARKLLPKQCECVSKMEAEGYIGTSIRDENGKNIGLLWLASRQKLVLPPRTKEVMEIIATKACSEIERMRMEETIRRHNEELETLVEERTARIMELERQRVENEKLAAAGRMAARVAHEINNPLGGISSSFILLKDAIPVNYKYFEYVDVIEKEIGRITRIVKQLFDLCRPHKGKISEFNSILSIREIINLLKILGDERGVIVSLNDCKDILKVTISEDFFKQILYNIIKNAIEASPRGSEVNIIVKDQNSLLIVMISDQGDGISDELRPKIFEPFFTTKDKYTDSGMGVGLSTTKSLVESMGGSLGFTSEKDKGTTFTIILPTNVIKQQDDNKD